MIAAMKTKSWSVFGPEISIVRALMSFANSQDRGLKPYQLADVIVRKTPSAGHLTVHGVSIFPVIFDP